jgi:hypothetical protein
MKKLKQTSLDQTGVAVLKLIDGDKVIPLFSENPIKEANEVGSLFPLGTEVKNVFVANNMLDFKIEDCIKDFQTYLPNTLPEDMMEELVSGFPYTYGYYTDTDLIQKFAYS